jgi:hypothetical protein
MASLWEVSDLVRQQSCFPSDDAEFLVANQQVFNDLATNLACGGGDDDHVSSLVASIALLYEAL